MLSSPGIPGSPTRNIEVLCPPLGPLMNLCQHVLLSGPSSSFLIAQPTGPWGSSQWCIQCSLLALVWTPSLWSILIWLFQALHFSSSFPRPPTKGSVVERVGQSCQHGSCWQGSGDFTWPLGLQGKPFIDEPISSSLGGVGSYT